MRLFVLLVGPSGGLFARLFVRLFARLFAGLQAMWKLNYAAKVSQSCFNVTNVIMNL